MMRVPAVLLVLAMMGLSGCASAPPKPTARPFDNVRRVAITVSGETNFTVQGAPSAEASRTVDEVLKWMPYQAWLRPLAALVQWGINWLQESNRKADAAANLGDVSPRSVVAEAFARTLEASGHFDEIRTLSREPLGDDRRRADAIVRVTVPAWGLVRVRQGNPDLLSAFADVRAEMVVRETGVVVWEKAEDVTDPERLPMKSFTGDREFTKQQLLDVLERAGQRLASELLYARSAGR